MTVTYTIAFANGWNDVCGDGSTATSYIRTKCHSGTLMPACCFMV